MLVEKNLQNITININFKFWWWAWAKKELLLKSSATITYWQ